MPHVNRAFKWKGRTVSGYSSALQKINETYLRVFLLFLFVSDIDHIAKHMSVSPKRIFNTIYLGSSEGFNVENQE